MEFHLTQENEFDAATRGHITSEEHWSIFFLVSLNTRAHLLLVLVLVVVGCGGGCGMMVMGCVCHSFC